jgi:hypothetical protein
MKAFTNRSVRLLTRLMLAGGLSFSVSSALAEAPWYLLEFADSKPPCVDTVADSRCVGTSPKVSRFEMRAGERIEIPEGQPLPPAWAEWNRLWIYAPAVTDQNLLRSIELAATPLGARLIVVDGDRRYLQSVELNRWQALRADNQPKLWVRVSPLREPSTE